MLCDNCKEREASVIWTGSGGTLDWTHGLYQNWCELCCLEAQLKHAKERALEIPKMEKRIEELKIEIISPILCEHANEVPAKCSCPPNCYCKLNTCKDKNK